MPFDPNLPAEDAPVQSPVLRDQFNALKALIDARPTTDAMNAAILAQTSGPTDMVEYPSTDFSDPPTATEVRALANKLIEVMNALRRQWP